MSEYEFELDVNDFELKDIFECGQCFRWNKQEDNSYTGIFRRNVVNVRKIDNKVIFKGIGMPDFKEQCIEYFDLARNYAQIKEKLSQSDSYLRGSIKFGQGIRILKQDVWETIISFIISANNNIPRIRGIIDRLSQQYGDKITWGNIEYYTFPTPQQLSNATVEDLRKLGLGFRDKRVYETTKIILNRGINLESIEDRDSEEIKQELIKLSGVGGKVADCIMLFSMQKFEVFPVDVWVRRVVNELYIKKSDENEPTQKEITDFAKMKFGDLAGIAQQYLYFWRREQK